MCASPAAALDAGPRVRASQDRRRIPRPAVSDEVYGTLRRQLLARRFPAGEHLNVDALARELYVSNTPVRQALTRLEAEGLVTKVPFRGFSASALLDVRGLLEVYDFRLMVEPPSAARCARPRDNAGPLLELCRRAEHRLDADHPVSRSTLQLWDAEFHRTIARLAGNGVVASQLEAMLSRASDDGIDCRVDNAHQAWAEHRTIVDAIEAANPFLADAAMRTHLENSRRRLHAASPRPGTTQALRVV